MRGRSRGLLMAALLLIQVAVTPISGVHAAVQESTTPKVTNQVADKASTLPPTTDQTPVPDTTVSPTQTPATKQSSTETPSKVTTTIGFADDSQQANGIPPNKPVTLYAGIGVPGDTNNLEKPTIKITIPKATYNQNDPDTNAPEPPDFSKVGGAYPNLIAANVVDGGDHWTITYQLAVIAAGSNDKGIPFILRTNNATIIGGTNGEPIKQVVYDANGHELASDQRAIKMLTYAYSVSMLSTEATAEYQSAELDSTRKYSNVEKDVSFPMQSLVLGTEARKTVMNITLPEGITFAGSDDDKEWTYNKNTRVVSLTLEKRMRVWSLLRFKIDKGAMVQDGSYLRISYTMAYPDGSVQNPYGGGPSDTMLVYFKEHKWAPTPSLKMTYASDGSQTKTRDQINAGTGAQSVLTLLSNYQTKPADTKVTIDHITEQMPTGTLTYLHQNGIKFVGPVSQEMSQNTVYGVDEKKNKTLLATNLGTNLVAIPERSYQSIEVDFSEPVTVDSEETGLAITSVFQQDGLDVFDRTNLISKNLPDQGSVGYLNFKQPDADGSITIGRSEASIIPSVKADKLSYLDDEGKAKPTLLIGQNLNVRSSFTLSSIKDEGTTTGLSNARIYYLLPQGLVYNASAATKVAGLKDITVKTNFNNSGQTAVIGTPTKEMNTNGTFSFSLPVKSDATLHRGSYDVTAYLFFTNNDGGYSNPGLETQDSFITDTLTDPNNLNLYQSSNDPTRGTLVRNPISYYPPEGLLSTSFVKMADAANFTLNLGSVGRAGSAVIFRDNLFASGIDNVSNVSAINQLPQVGDSRGSKFAVKMSGPVTVSKDYDSKFDVLYSVDKPQLADSGVTDYNQANWQPKTEITDFSKVTMFKFVLKDGQTIKSGDDINFDFPATLANNPAIKDGSQAHNYFLVNRSQSTLNNFSDSVGSTVSINVPTGDAVINKISSQDQTPLSGAEFALYNAATDQQLNASTVYRSGFNGKVTIPDLKPGKYYVIETKVPAGYQQSLTTDEQKRANSFEITADQSGPVNISIENTPRESFLIKKIAGDTQKPLAGAHFQIKNSAGQVAVADIATDTTGEAKVYGLPNGTYLATEIKAPTGYALNGTPYEFQITADSQLQSHQFINNKVNGLVTIINSDQTTGDLLAGGKFKLVKINNDNDTKTDQVISDELTTNDQGQVVSPNLAVGDYQVSQTGAKIGYHVDPLKHNFSITADQQAATVNIKNKKILGSLTLFNQSPTSAPLTGAKFSLYRLENGLSTPVFENVASDDQGKLVHENLLPGKYSLVQVAAPTGNYLLATAPVEFSITLDQPDVTQTIINQKMAPTPEPEHTLQINKTDETTKAPLAGAHFEIKDTNGKVIAADLVTNNLGQVRQADLAAGTYTIIETQAPVGYQLDATPTKVTITTTTDVLQKDITNQAKTGALTILNQEKSSNLPLNGGQFNLYQVRANKEELVAKDLTVTKDGKLQKTGLAIGSYILRQTKSPVGYRLNNTAYTFALTNAELSAQQVVSNEKILGSLTVLNQGQDTKPLSGAKFSLYRIENGLTKPVFENVASDEQGRLVKNSLLPGNYSLQQVTAPTGGYQLSAQPVTFSITLTNLDVTQTVINQKNVPAPEPKHTLQISKVDEATKVALSGAHFAVKDDNGQTIAADLVTDGQGQVQLAGLAAGHYTIIETQAPLGYQLNAAPITATITATTTTLQKEITNRAKTGTLTIRNQAKSSQQALNGGQFDLYQIINGQEKLVAKALTIAAAGQLQKTNLATGSYILRQVKAPAGYALDNTTYPFVITNDQLSVQQLILNQKLSSNAGGDNSSKPNPAGQQKVKATGKKSSQRQLPQSSEQHQQILQLLGWSLLVLLGIPAIFKKAEDRD